ncbi:MAG: signal peptide peptidase SppA [Myxococcales bacterium]|nr:signal peptide peptidase SppA [Myxococcales bacterium]
MGKWTAWISMSLVSALALGCKGGDGDKVDPWSTPPKGGAAAGKASANGEGDTLDTENLQAMLEKLGKAIEQPGPYEAPKASASQDDSKPYVALMSLDGGVAELETYSWSGASGASLREMRTRLASLGGDANVTAVLLRMSALDISLADAQELRETMLAVRKAGKPIHCHAERLSNAEYVVATACESIALAPLGELAIPGPLTMPIHFKGLLDRLGVTADFLHVGAYKGAAEPLTRREPSPEMRETLGEIVGSAHAWMVATISSDRKLPPEAVVAAIDQALFGAEEAQAAKLIDSVASFEAWRDGHGAWKSVPWRVENSLHSAMKLMTFLGIVPSSRPTAPHVALVYAVGNIADGAGDGVLGAREGIYSHTLVSALRVLTDDDNVKAVVLRIDSGGGSAQASELIWHQLSALAGKKPLVVSMSDYAASGGYYIAAPAARIFALPTTLTGSIGVVGGKLAPGKALAKLGIDTYAIGKGKRAGIYSSLAPWTADEKSAIEASMKRVYQAFVGRVAQGRGKTAAQVEPLAQGRVWTGGAALANGLIDEHGGLDAAIAFAQEKSGVAPSVPLEVYPPEPTLRDVVVSMGGVTEGLVGELVKAGVGDLATNAGLPRAMTKTLLAYVTSFATTHVQTVVILPQIH